VSQLVRVVEAKEPWAEYQLEDGTRLRFRLTACNFRLTGKLTDLGDPEYSFSHQLQIETHVPKQAVSERPIGPGFPVNVRPSDYCASAEDCG
jgi:hypothetical protein